jgi:hypothetical protein
MMMEYTQDDYCSILLTLGTYNSRAGTAAQEYMPCYPGQCHVDTSVFQLLEQCLGETGNVAPMAHVTADRPSTVRTPANEDVSCSGGM